MIYKALINFKIFKVVAILGTLVVAGGYAIYKIFEALDKSLALIDERT